MYTGIVQAMLPIHSVERKPGLMTFSILLQDELLAELATGASVAVNGCCFTVTEIKGEEVFFDAVAETMAISNIKHLQTGTLVNVERSAKSGVEVGGHILSGHIIDVAEVTDILESENNRRITFKGQPDWLKFVFNKGFLALNGASLTVAELNRDTAEFAVNLIPETLKRTNFALLSQGDSVNVEVDAQTQAIVETVERVLSEREADTVTS